MPQPSSQKPFIVISADSHAGGRMEDYRPYIDKQYLAQFERTIAERTPSGSPRALDAAAVANGMMVGGTTVSLRGKQIEESYSNEEAVKAGGLAGAWDATVRHREMNREGVAAEVIFPNGHPFGGRGLGANNIAYELRLAGARAYNRWLADLCASDSARHAGVAMLCWDDIPTALEDLKWAKQHGLRGLLLPELPLITNDPQWLLHHPRYEPVWALAEELQMPLSIHSNGSGVNYGDLPGARWIHSSEAYWTSRRALSQLMWSGVLERHPTLKVMMAEVMGGWLPYELQLWEYLYDARNPEVIRQTLKLRPGEYWRRQCFIGASPPSGRLEIDSRYIIGVNNLMWGSDFPHIDGLWPRSNKRIRELFAGVSEPETRAILGENGVKLYGFDHAKLQAIADKIGPVPSDIHATPPDRGLPYKLAFINGVTPEIPEPAQR